MRIYVFVRKGIILFILLHFTTLCVAQKHDVHNFQIGFVIAPEIGYRSLYSTDSLFKAHMLRFREDVEKPASGFTIGAQVKYKLTKNWKIRTGLVLNERCYKQPKTSINYITSTYGLGYVLKYEGTTAISEKFRIGYISLPITAEHQWNIKKIGLGFFAGCTVDWPVYYKSNTIEYDKQDNKKPYVQNLSFMLKNYKKPVGNILAGCFVNIPVKQKVALSLEPFTKFSSPVIKNPGLTGYLYNGGLNFSILYSL
jgi:hypothetical protein